MLKQLAGAALGLSFVVFSHTSQARFRPYRFKGRSKHLRCREQ